MFWGPCFAFVVVLITKVVEIKDEKETHLQFMVWGGMFAWMTPLGPLLVVPLISKRKSTFWRDWSVKKKTPCCKHSPSSISMLLRIVRKGGKTLHTARTVYTKKRLFFSDSTSKSNECVSLRTGITRHHWQPSKFMSPKWYSIQIV